MKALSEMNLFYRRYGEGPPLIILHGLFGSSDNWITIARKLSGDFTVYLPDMRNHGLSPHSPVHDYEAMTDDIYEFSIQEGLDRFFLAGHSMGGKAAIRFALQWTGKLSGLLIADISPFTPDGREKIYYNQYLSVLKAMQSVDLKEIISRTQVEKNLSKKIESARIREFILKNLKRDKENSFSWKINIASLLQNLHKITGGINVPAEDPRGTSSFPVVFLKGARSEYLPETDMPFIRKIFPGAELINIPDAGHWIHADKPDAVADALRSLLYRD